MPNNYFRIPPANSGSGEYVDAIHEGLLAWINAPEDETFDESDVLEGIQMILTAYDENY